MPGLPQFSNGSSPPMNSISANGFWSKNRDDVGYNQLHKFWSELSPQARQELLRIDKQTLFEQARKNMYCSRCNGLLLEGFLQIVMYGKSLQPEGAGVQFPCGRPGGLKNQSYGGSSLSNGVQDEIRDPSVHPWGGLTTTREGSLTLMDCYLYSKSLKGLQIVFDGARARERERELLYPDACGGGGRGWISQGIVSYGRGHGTRETCALHTARLSCDTLVDFWSALGEETRQSLLRMKEEDFIERLMFRFDSKRFCRDCRRNVIREFKELKELKRMRREPRCTSWFCVADTAFLYEVSDDSIQADWRHTFADTVGSYHHFEWAVGTSEGKSDILEFENVGTSGCVQASGLDLGGLSACFITLRAWKLDGRCTEFCVKAHALKGQECVHCRLIVGDGYVTITKGESIKRFFEHAEEAEEEEDDDLMDKDGNELDGECTRPQKHAKSPELAREFLLDAATVIFKEQVEKAFREGTARQNAHSIFVCLALKLLEERVHVACKEIVTLEKQTKLLEEEEKEKREEEERKERKRAKEREKKLRRKERLKGKDKNKERNCSESVDVPSSPEASKEELSAPVDSEQNNAITCMNSGNATEEANLSQCDYPNIQDDDFSSEGSTLRAQDCAYGDYDGDIVNAHDINDTSTVDQPKFYHQRLRYRKEFQPDMSSKWSDRSEPRHYGDNFGTSSRGISVLNRQSKINVPKTSGRNSGHKCNEKPYSSNYRMSEKYDFHSCSCSVNNKMTRSSWEMKAASKAESTVDTSRQFYRGSKYNQVDSMHESSGRLKSRVFSGNYFQSKKVWEPTESFNKYARSNSDSDVTLRSTGQVCQFDSVKSPVDEVDDSGEIDNDGSDLKRSGMTEDCQNDLDAEAEGSCSSIETKRSTINNSSDHSQGSISSSDNCSSCLSEGDNNTTSSNRENTESSNSDSEDASQIYEVRDSSVRDDNDLSGRYEHGIEKTHNTNGDGQSSRLQSVTSLDVVESESFGNPVLETAQNFENGTVQNFENCLSSTNVCSQPESMPPPTATNRNIQFPVFQTPSTMSYYHQNPVPWPSAAPTNGLVPILHPNQYLYAGPLGYNLNEDPRYCLQYGSLQQPTPQFNHAAIPVYHPVARAKGLNGEELTQTSKPSSMQDHMHESIAERFVPHAPNSRKAVLSGEDRHGHGNSAKSQDSNNGFSLFQFGGPVAFSNQCKRAAASSDYVGDFNSKSFPDQVEKDHGCNKKENAFIEEYNLFAASNTWFTIF
ncbi:uncharacterized protein LOC131644741 [Vicia villosa]|uniref:uncharacterized protein LOC131644741 n=1 Tax=Vicia villosa TaxID=3911 RepID=UPI00273B48AD|nr:uncharacterized protein LOC131644741 [Vicia villosa]